MHMITLPMKVEQRFPNNALMLLVSYHGDLTAEADEFEGMARLSLGWRYGARQKRQEPSQLYHHFAFQGGLNSSLVSVPNRCSDSGLEASLLGWFARPFQTPDKKYPQGGCFPPHCT